MLSLLWGLSRGRFERVSMDWVGQNTAYVSLFFFIGCGRSFFDLGRKVISLTREFRRGVSFI